MLKMSFEANADIWLTALLDIAEAAQVLRERIHRATKNECSPAFYHELLDLAPDVDKRLEKVVS